MFSYLLLHSRKKCATRSGLRRRKPDGREGLLVKGGVYLVNHILEGLRLVKDGPLFQEAFHVIEKLGFI